MPSFNLRKFHDAIVQAELTGQTWFFGAPCKRDKAHVNDKGSTKRDTIKRTCLACDARVKENNLGA
jgi:hypothetical protein